MDFPLVTGLSWTGVGFFPLHFHCKEGPWLDWVSYSMQVFTRVKDKNKSVLVLAYALQLNLALCFQANLQ